jgi:lactate dehydrogenase-like 2-hydroxyacid dehydrogenase
MAISTSEIISARTRPLANSQNVITAITIAATACKEGGAMNSRTRFAAGCPKDIACARPTASAASLPAALARAAAPRHKGAMSKTAVLVHPPLGLFETQLANQYDVVHWPTDRKDIRAAVTIGHVGLSNAMIDALPELKAIICFGVGVDGLDLGYCRKRGLAIAHGRDINHEDVADVAMGLIIAVARTFTLGERVLREGTWTPPLAVPPQRRLRGRKLGIVGMGAIGKALAARAAGFGLELRWFGPRPKPDIALPYEKDLAALASWADILAVCARGEKSTEKLIDARIIEALGGDGILVNVSRGSVLDEDAVIAALKAGKLGGAGLDVFVEEPTPAARWRDVPNTTLTPHLGGGTREALYAGSQNVLENLRRAIAGEKLLSPLE